MRTLPDAEAGGQDGSKPSASELELARAGCGACGELLHGLNNALASVLLNAQVMAWKLPSYSRGKRYLHEIERNAQRAGELVKLLLQRSQADCQLSQCPGHSDREAVSVVGFEGAAPTCEGNVPTQPSQQRPTP